ncbi:MAG: hypothetical protein U0235_15410 [Polyangiaceae bacterium]
MTGRAVFVVIAVALAASLPPLAACTGDAPAPNDAGAATDAAPVDAGADATAVTCPNDLPKACPTPPPSYQGSVAAIFEARCSACHSGPAPVGAYDFSTYDGVAARRSQILNQVYACRMPPADAAPPSADERAALLAWLVCRAPNN